MFTIFLDGIKEYEIVILPEGQKMNNTHFIECVLRPLIEICYPQGMGYMKGELYCIMTMGRFITLRGSREFGEFQIQKNGASAL
jgi:hypothetical protein